MGISTTIFSQIYPEIQTSQSGNTEYWIKIYDSSGNCGYADTSGKIKIELGKYQQCFTDTMINFAIVYKPSKGFMAINKQEEELFKVFVVDNGPDYVKEGLFRIINQNKIGFANKMGEVVIEPQFYYAEPFHEGLAAFCIDCKAKSNDEHSLIVGGLWGFINREGVVVSKPLFERNWSKKLNMYVFEKNNEFKKVSNGKISDLSINESIILSNELAANNEIDEAINILKNAEKIDGKNYNVLIGIVALSKQKGDFDTAIEYCEKIIKFCDDDKKEIAKKLIRGMQIK